MPALLNETYNFPSDARFDAPDAARCWDRRKSMLVQPIRPGGGVGPKNARRIAADTLRKQGVEFPEFRETN
jgi:hypothetical protein